ncbi:ATP-dependent helicase [Cystobacter fuscus]|nr:ATP-dependent helicase [Cystobacter fuscus]
MLFSNPMKQEGAVQHQLDAQQQSIVGAPPSARLIVEAGPGCGKTRVACARVAGLLGKGEVPDRILLLSFTRTAVHEMRNRIAQMVGAGVSAVRGVEIRTIDSFAWRITTGVQEVTINSYEDSIQAACSALAHPDDELRSYLNRFNQVLVDEAQDLVGPRAALILTFLNALRKDAGWTVFLDPAQSIYGWSNDSGESGPGEGFLSKLDQLKGAVQRIPLTRIYRTTRPQLLELLSKTRSIALDVPSGSRLDQMQAELENRAAPEQHNPSDMVELVKSLGQEAGDSLLLFRWRVDALMAASYLTGAGISYRLRLGGMPRVAAPWIALVANALARARVRMSGVSREEFDQAWASECAPRWLASGWTADSAWELLRRIGPSGKFYVDFRRVADRLAVAVLPDEAFVKDIGPSGPIIGTVHGSKGREARHVFFCLPPGTRDCESDNEADEEARVLYVAVSRATQQVRVLRGTELGRAYHEHRPWRNVHRGLQVELGREGDVDPVWPLCMEYGKEAEAQQGALADFDGQVRTVHIQTEGRSSWTRRIILDGEERKLLGTLSKRCLEELGEIMKLQHARGAPLRIGFLSWMDVTTVAMHADDSRLSKLGFPWNETRLWLAPVIAGMGYIKKYW